MKRLLLALLLLAAPLAAQDQYDATIRPNCTDGSPWLIIVINAAADDDCSTTGGGLFEVACLCVDGVYYELPGAAGGGLSSTDIDTSAKLRGILTDEDGTGAALFAGASATTAFGSGTVPTARLGSGTANGTTFLRGDQTYASVTLTSGGRVQSWMNPPASAHAQDDEFNDGDITGWTIYSSSLFASTTNPATSGTIDYTASLTTPIVDAASIPGWVAFQSDNSAVKDWGIKKAITLDTNCTLFFGVTIANTGASTNHGDLRIMLLDSADTNEQVAWNLEKAGTGPRPQIYVQNNGAQTSISGGQVTNNAFGVDGEIGVVVWKKSNVYHMAWIGANGGAFTYLGAVTKTGVTTLNELRIFGLTASFTPSKVMAADFFRYKASLDYSLVNP